MVACSVLVFIDTPTSAGGPDMRSHKRRHTGPPALRAPAGREPDRRHALSRVSDRALVCVVAPPRRCSPASPSSSLLAAEAAALGAYVAVFMNTSTKPQARILLVEDEIHLARPL